MLVHWFQEWVINTLWNKVSRQVLHDVLNYSDELWLGNCEPWQRLGVLNGIVGTVRKSHTSLHRLPYECHGPRFHKSDKVTMCQINPHLLDHLIPMGRGYQHYPRHWRSVDRWKYHRLLPRAPQLLEKERDPCSPKGVRNSVIKSKTWLLFFGIQPNFLSSKAINSGSVSKGFTQLWVKVWGLSLIPLVKSLLLVSWSFSLTHRHRFFQATHKAHIKFRLPQASS